MASLHFRLLLIYLNDHADLHHVNQILAPIICSPSPIVCIVISERSDPRQILNARYKASPLSCFWKHCKGSAEISVIWPNDWHDLAVQLFFPEHRVFPQASVVQIHLSVRSTPGMVDQHTIGPLAPIGYHASHVAIAAGLSSSVRDEDMLKQWHVATRFSYVLATHPGNDKGLGMMTSGKGFRILAGHFMPPLCPVCRSNLFLEQTISCRCRAIAYCSHHCASIHLLRHFRTCPRKCYISVCNDGTCSQCKAPWPGRPYSSWNKHWRSFFGRYNNAQESWREWF